MVGDAELLHRVVELAAPVLAEPVVAVGGEVLELGHQDLAHLPGRAGDQGDAAAHGDVLRHRRAVLDRLVVGVGVDEEDALVGYGSHGFEPRPSPDSGLRGRMARSLSRNPATDRMRRGLETGANGDLNHRGDDADLRQERDGRGRASRRRRARRRPASGPASCSTGSGSPATSAATATRSTRRVGDRAPRRRASATTAIPHAELLAYLPHQRRLGRLARLDLAAGELPAAGGRGGRRTAAGQHPPVAHDRGADDDPRRQRT